MTVILDSLSGNSHASVSSGLVSGDFFWFFGWATVPCFVTSCACNSVLGFTPLKKQPPLTVALGWFGPSAVSPARDSGGFPHLFCVDLVVSSLGVCTCKFPVRGMCGLFSGTRNLFLPLVSICGTADPVEQPQASQLLLVSIVTRLLEYSSSHQSCKLV